MFKKIIKNIIEEKVTYLFYAPGARGNAVARIIHAHIEDYWWVNYLTGYDDDLGFLKNPLDHTELEKGQSVKDGKYCKTTVHFPIDFISIGTVGLRKKYGSDYLQQKNPKIDIYEHIEEQIKSFDAGQKQTLHSFLVEGKKITLSTHYFTHKMITNFEKTNVPIIHAWADRSYYTRGLGNKDRYDVYYKPLHLCGFNIYNLEVPKLFSEDWYEYSDEFDKLSEYLKFQHPRKNAVRAFILAYLERNRLFENEDFSIFKEHIAYAKEKNTPKRIEEN
tara:strand:- start:2165 stop:2992 length:828 start_codon:yes stop_codon:yes gene_type:complete